MRLLAIGLLAVGLALSLAPARADACSVTATFIPPTNVELVAEAGRIVVATVKGAAGAEQVELELTRVIKGSGVAVGELIRVRGALIRYRGASKPGDFARARPGAYAGSCTAWDYAVGTSYVLLLKQFASGWDTMGVPFARVNEEAEPIWLRAVEEYTRVAALPDVRARRAALDALIARGKANKASPADKAIAADVEHHLAAPTPAKPFANLFAMYRKASAGQRAAVVMAIAVGGDPAAAGFMRSLLSRARLGNPPVGERILFDAIGAYFDKVPDVAALGDVAELYVSLGSKRKQDRWPLMNLLIHRAADAHKDVMTRALAGADDEEAGRISAWFVRHPSPAALDDTRARIGSDYAQRWELTLALAGMGDGKVVAWAKRRLADPPDDDRWIALYVLACSPRKDADALARKVIAKGGDDLTSLIQGYKDAAHPHAGARLKEIGVRALTADQKKWLERTLAERAAPR